METFHSLFHSTAELASGSVQVTAAIEEVTAETVTRNRTYRAERQFDEALLLILTEEGTQQYSEEAY